MSTEEQSQEITQQRRLIDDRERHCKQMEAEFKDFCEDIAQDREKQS